MLQAGITASDTDFPIHLSQRATGPARRHTRSSKRRAGPSLGHHPETSTGCTLRDTPPKAQTPRGPIARASHGDLRDALSRVTERIAYPDGHHPRAREFALFDALRTAERQVATLLLERSALRATLHAHRTACETAGAQHAGPQHAQAQAGTSAWCAEGQGSSTGSRSAPVEEQSPKAALSSTLSSTDARCAELEQALRAAGDELQRLRADAELAKHVSLRLVADVKAEAHARQGLAAALELERGVRRALERELFELSRVGSWRGCGTS
ncbi:hypothetical protein PsYK624_103530 [Phanerochaete sordida]|uniref:Uncharacterized protein n=1 Tax=Phanerochaete sordida TaxID=48140 RepID=A0A9P3GIC3_9APHY|nr:hypothetical protein PsYK624_103530 [Phanerochaete sordida]